ncbi:MAG: tRNA threonylcarbamoyladenosine dehydratase [Eubacteriales bacterium]
MDRFLREILAIGEENFEKINKAKVAVIGLGGVGSFAAEALARAGVSNIVLVDGDKVDITNINRQLIALTSTLFKYKASVFKDRILDINPDAKVTQICEFLSKDNLIDYITKDINYVIDAIDMISVKIDIICHCKANGIPVVSSMGTGNKLHPELFKVSDIYSTKKDPIARVLRRELKKRGVDSLKVVYSDEDTAGRGIISEKGSNKTGSISFVPGVAGMILASQVILDIIDS